MMCREEWILVVFVLELAKKVKALQEGERWAA
jgi:hypothetical protein